LAAAKLYTDSAVNTEAAARQAGDATLQSNINSIQQTGGSGGGGGSVPQQLLDLAPYLSVQTGTINGVAGPHVILTGVNLHIRNGQPRQYDHSSPTFDTASYLANGLGNLIVGYNDDLGFNLSSQRTGSHNLIVGDGHRFDASGGFLAGFYNYVAVNAGAVSGGYDNHAYNFAASVSGGSANFAIGQVSSISGGYGGFANGDASSVAGGNNNYADGNYSSVTGGIGNSASGFISSVNGGGQNTASGEGSSVAGGQNQTASGDYATAP